MAVHDFRSQRLFIDAPLHGGGRIDCSKEQANYLRNVLRLGGGDAILVFNGRDGEWRAKVSTTGRRDCALDVDEKVREQQSGPDVDYLFAPLKRARLDYMVQKATELGVASLQPVLTRHTIAERVNLERMHANVIEAAEQCGVLRIPDVRQPSKLAEVLANWPAGRHLIFADEGAEIANPVAALATLQPGAPCAVLIGPEGGFSDDERAMLGDRPETLTLSLGPRIMRADTAAVAALTLVNAVLGDWRGA